MTHFLAPLSRITAKRPQTALPIESLLPELLLALDAHACCVLEAAPGAGKTTLVPLALLDAPWLAGKGVVMLEPRRMAARSAARYMASLLGEPVGQTVGYRVRLESRVSAATRITVVTEGVLTRMLQEDPELEGVGCLVFDEFHERNLHGDVGLALALDCQQGLREDLRLLVMSATLETGRVAELLQENCPNLPVLRSEGRVWPVETRYVPAARKDAPLEQHAAEVVRRALREESGSVLVFLPGAGEIRKVQALLESLQSETLALCPLFGDLSSEAQDAAIAPAAPSCRKVVLATSIAETSLTIEGVRVVVDAGLSRSVRFDPGTGLSRMVTGRVSLAGAAQRRGRAGRTEPGVCYRLWHQGEEAGMPQYRRPEILDADMAPLCLELAVWGVDAPERLRWLDTPPQEAFRQAGGLLQALDALDASGRVTARGRSMAKMPLHPRLAYMVLEARRWGLERRACLLAALAGERDPLGTREADCRLRLALLEQGTGSGNTARIREAAKHIARQIPKTETALEPFSECVEEGEEAGLLLALAYPDRLAVRRARGSFRMANGRGAMLDEKDALADAPLLSVGELDGAGGNAKIWQAAPLSLQTVEAVFGARITTTSLLEWNPREEAVTGSQRRCLGALVLDEKPLPVRDGEGVARAVLAGIRSLGLRVLPWTEELEAWRLRVRLLREIEGAELWPDVSDAALLETLEVWLESFVAGVTRRAHFAKIDLAAALHALVPWSAGRRLEAEAPSHVEVPSGSRIRLRYEEGPEGVVPVLAVKLQELFGMRVTPRLAGGRVPVLIHLLSPAGRPLQITKDIESFWKNGYPAVRAEMRGRYPRHPWPDDPLVAVPTRRVKPRS